MIIPVDVELFGDPLPWNHPWGGSPENHWTQAGSLRSHVVARSGMCTLCKQGITACKKMRLTDDWRRATCIKCIKCSLMLDPELKLRADQVLEQLRVHRSPTRLARGISWWRMVGAAKHCAAPGWVEEFFVPSDTAHTTAEVTT